MKKAYHEIREALREMIASDNGKMKRLPTLRVLAKEFGCSPPTVLRAVRDLMNEGSLSMLRGGGYMTIPGNESPEDSKVVAMVIGSGMLSHLDSYYCRMRYHASCALSCCGNLAQVKIADLSLETHDGLFRLISRRTYAGVILVNPTPLIIKQIQKIRRNMAIPFGVFGGVDSCGPVSMTFDMNGNFTQLMRKLKERRSRRILAVSSAGNRWNAEMESVMARCSDWFETTECCWNDQGQQASDYLLENVSGKGRNFDTVVFIMFIPGLYSRLRESAPDCFCAMPEFAAIYEPDFRGLVMRFDLETAGRNFGCAMYELICGREPAHPHGTIPFEIEER